MRDLLSSARRHKCLILWSSFSLGSAKASAKRYIVTYRSSGVIVDEEKALIVIVMGLLVFGMCLRL